MKELNSYQLLLLALAECPDPTPHGVLVLKAWELFPAVFGLRGHESASASDNAVSAVVYGKCRLIRRGWVALAGPKLYRLTEAGRAEIKAIRAGRYAGRKQGGWQIGRYQFARVMRRAPATLATVAKLEAGQMPGGDEVADLAVVHRVLLGRFGRHMEEA